jgi:hypothetical protein
MTHLDNHPQAFIDANNIVINVLAYSSHDTDLIAATKTVQEEVFGKTLTPIDCCVEGWANVDEKWLGEGKGWLLPQPFASWILNEEGNAWVAPKERPTPALDYYWDEDTLDWVKY